VPGFASPGSLPTTPGAKRWSLVIIAVNLTKLGSLEVVFGSSPINRPIATWCPNVPLLPKIICSNGSSSHCCFPQFVWCRSISICFPIHCKRLGWLNFWCFSARVTVKNMLLNLSESSSRTVTIRIKNKPG
jgi:hypothetical protein